MTDTRALLRGAAGASLSFLSFACAHTRPLPPAEGASPGATVTMAANPDYAASVPHRFFFGSGYRTLWALPIRVEVLDLATFSGGLRPEKKGGGMQTKSLHFEAADGREYRVRSVDKDPSPTVPPELRGTFVEALVQDQISSAHPAGSLIVEPLEEAAGLLHRPRRLVVVPDDPRLGEFRAEFAGLLGILEEKPRTEAPITPGFEEVEEILEWEDFEKALERGEARLDTRAYLRARLLDMLVGDWDRHQGQWEWAKVRGDPLWQPIPTDRDQAFTRFDGFVIRAVRNTRPQLVTFASDYPNVVGLAWNSRELDRRFLGELDRPDFEAAARDLQGRLTDTVIENAARRMPAEYLRHSGEAVIRRLKARRGRLAEVARDFYELLAREAEIHGTGQADTVEVVRGERPGETQLRAFRGEAGGAPLFARTFREEDTREVRVYLKDGHDTVRTSGRPHGITLRVVGGPGDDTLDDSRGGGTRFYDHEGSNLLLRGDGTEESNAGFEHPVDRRGYRLRDWGSESMTMPLLSGGGEVGLLAGLELRRTRYGFRSFPWASRHTWRGAYATSHRGLRLEYDGEFAHTNSRKRRGLFARASNVEIVQFYGFGNQTPRGSTSFHRTDVRQFLLRPSFRFGFDAPVDLRVGAVAKLTQAQLDPNRFITLARPYGSDDFGQVGFGAALVLDGRDVPANATRGALLSLGGNVYPKAWDVEEAFGDAQGQLAAYLTPARPVTLALRVAGRKLWGRYPFFEAAFLGGPDTIRGLGRERFAGDAMAFGNAELRLRAFEAKLLVPVQVGIFALADGGRVFFEGEDSDRWHTAVGGGLSFAFIKPANTLTVSLARGEGDLRVYFQGGFAF